MRDPERIDDVLDLIDQIWRRYPDLRFQQLMFNLQSEYSQQNDGVGRVERVEKDGFTKVGYDLFNLEDDVFTQFLREKAKSGFGG